MKQEEVLPSGNETSTFSATHLHRRKFLSQVGLAAAAATGLAACTKTLSSENSVSGNNVSNSSYVTDIAILNYAFLLEQLEAAFYTMVADHFYSGIDMLERARLRQIRDHEIAHREFFKTALGTHALPDLQFNFSSINFSDRMSVLTAAKTFEDTGVSAYNGIAYAINSPDYLLVAGKIVSVEARHAAYLRDLLDPISFADHTVVNSNGLDLANRPGVVIKAVLPYLLFVPDMKSFPYNI